MKQVINLRLMPRLWTEGDCISLKIANIQFKFVKEEAKGKFDKGVASHIG